MSSSPSGCDFVAFLLVLEVAHNTRVKEQIDCHINVHCWRIPATIDVEKALGFASKSNGSQQFVSFQNVFKILFVSKYKGGNSNC